MGTDHWYMGRHIGAFNSWMFDPMCDDWKQFGYFDNETQCESFDSGLAVQGYFNILMDYVYLCSGIQAIGSTNTSAVFNSDTWVTLRVMTRYMFHTMNDQYMEHILGQASDIAFNAQMIMLSVALIYLILGTLAFFLLWLPHVLRLRHEICKTNAMLLLIPPSVYLNSRFLREAFEKKAAMLSQKS